MPLQYANTSTRTTTESFCPILHTISEGKPIKTNIARDPELPQMYEVFDHPLQPPGSRSIVYLADLTISGQIKSLEVASRQRVPGPGLDCAKESGMYNMYKIFKRYLNTITLRSCILKSGGDSIHSRYARQWESKRR